MWKLTYLDCNERLANGFSQFGNLVHTALELFFKGELEVWDLVDYYTENFDRQITESFPPYPVGMRDSYYQDGLTFFENFKFDKSKYEILGIEDNLHPIYRGQKFIAKPDIVLKNKSNKNNILLDYKTSKLGVNKKYNEKKIEGYRKQLELYAYFLWTEKNIEIDKIFLWFIRNNEFVELDVDRMKIMDTLDWATKTIEDIKVEENWEPNNSKENKYFCENLCGMRILCKYKNEINA
jgi:CRISPR/Cas system-associated exonuclease Cas4 (RecB family)